MGLQHLEQDCPLTLAEGLREYFAGIEGLLMMPRVLLAVWRCLRMDRKWPYWDNDEWLDVPLSELRAAFDIRVVRH